LLLLVLLLVFGAKRLPELGHSLGHGMREFKDSISGASPIEPSDPAARLAAAPVSVETPVDDTFGLVAEKAPAVQVLAGAAPPQPSHDQL
jgi:sec-independent protein translocase protein TatA